MPLPYAVSLGGVTVGAAILILFLLRWWFREKHRPAALVPFLLSLAYGMLIILSAGSALSLLGVGGWVVLWAGNLAGYAGLVYGVGGTSPSVTRHHAIALSEGGHVVVLLLTVVLVGLWVWAKKVPNGKIAAGISSGICLALSGTLAGIAAVPLGSGANLLGLGFTRRFS
ncbi:hypothetical protein ACFO3J_24230 [Streptomyces polygonati]|uniref:Uncharacterized protein n=1 Tax=Streptomyces polygonati TaxID=1617087 RepID=A0ABV8HR95_9ACTN